MESVNIDENVIVPYDPNKRSNSEDLGLRYAYSHKYCPQDLCDNCIDLLLGWAWHNLKPSDPYWSKVVFHHD